MEIRPQAEVWWIHTPKFVWEPMCMCICVHVFGKAGGPRVFLASAQVQKLFTGPYMNTRGFEGLT